MAGLRAGDRVDTVLLEGDEVRLPLTDVDAAVVVNVGGHGFYRVSYSDGLRGRLTSEVVATMSTLERYNLVDDAWNAVTAGTLDALEYVELVERFGDEREYGVWQSIAIGLRGVRRLLADGDAAVAGFEQRVVTLVGPALDALGGPVDGEPDMTAKLRGLLLAMLAVQGADSTAQERARGYYADWSDDPTSVDAELAAAATGVIAATVVSNAVAFVLYLSVQLRVFELRLGRYVQTVLLPNAAAAGTSAAVVLALLAWSTPASLIATGIYLGAGVSLGLAVFWSVGLDAHERRCHWQSILRQLSEAANVGDVADVSSTMKNRQRTNPLPHPRRQPHRRHRE